MAATETFYHAVWTDGPAAGSPEVREYAEFRLRNTVAVYRTGQTPAVTPTSKSR